MTTTPPASPGLSLLLAGPFQKYAAALLPFAILVFGGLQTVIDNPGNWTVIVSFGLLVLGNVGTFAVKILPGAWAGRLKTGVAILFAILSAVAPFILPSGFAPGASATLIIVAILNVLSVEFGVQIRQAPMDLRSIPSDVIPDISTLPPAVPGVTNTSSSPVIGHLDL